MLSPRIKPRILLLGILDFHGIILNIFRDLALINPPVATRFKSVKNYLPKTVFQEIDESVRFEVIACLFCKRAFKIWLNIVLSRTLQGLFRSYRGSWRKWSSDVPKALLIGGCEAS